MSSQESSDKAFLSLKSKNVFNAWLVKTLSCVAASFS